MQDKREGRIRTEKAIQEFRENACLVPLTERDFILNVIDRAIRLNNNSTNSILVHVDDIKSAFKISANKIKAFGEALERYGVGDIGLYGTGDKDEYHIRVSHPSDYVTWFEIKQFCNMSGTILQDYVVDLQFGKLD